MTPPREELSAEEPEAEPFPRPSPAINRFVDRLRACRSHHRVTPELVAAWQRDSVATFARLGAEGSLLQRVLEETDWKLRDDPAPADVWGGEILVPATGAPFVALYRESPLTQVPSGFLFRHLGQLTVDHMFGHLYPYYAGEADYGELVASRWQLYALWCRGRLGHRFLAVIFLIVHGLHKEMSVSELLRPPQPLPPRRHRLWQRRERSEVPARTT